MQHFTAMQKAMCLVFTNLFTQGFNMANLHYTDKKPTLHSIIQVYSTTMQGFQSVFGASGTKSI